MIEASLVKHIAMICSSLGNRIFPNVLPEQVQLPAALYERVSSVRISSHSGYTRLMRGRFQFSFVALQLSQVIDIRKQIINNLMDYRGTLGGVGGTDCGRIFIENEQTSYNADNKRHILQVDIVVWYEEVY